MGKASNIWIVVATDAQLVAATDKDAHPADVPTLIEHMREHELDEGGLHEATLLFARDLVARQHPRIARDLNWPENTSAAYASFSRGHVYPGAEDLLAVARFQPADTWTIRLRLHSNIRWEAFQALMAPVPHA